MTLPEWHKSSYSTQSQNCVEVTEGPVTSVRDTRHRELGQLTFSSNEWQAFLGSVKENQL